MKKYICLIQQRIQLHIAATLLTIELVQRWNLSVIDQFWSFIIHKLFYYQYLNMCKFFAFTGFQNML